MKILFLSKEQPYFEKLGSMYISGMLRKHKHQAKLSIIDKLNFKEIKSEISRYQPDILAYSIVTGEHIYFLGLNKKLKKYFDILSIFGGPHPTFFPEIINAEGVDAICIGEGEYALLELANALRDNKPIENIANLWVRKNNQIFKNDLRLLIEDLDNLPFPDRDFMYEGAPKLKRYKTKSFQISRGCPYSCSYCFNHAYNKIYEGRGKTLRHRSVANLIEEISRVKEKYPLEFIWFIDDTFLLKPDGWLEEFAHNYKKKAGIPFLCNVRVDLVNDDNVRLLEEAGCYSVWFGLECADPDIRNNLLKRKMTNEQILSTCALLRKRGIKFGTQSICGLPVEKALNTDFETLDLNIKCRPDFALTSIFYPYPKTGLGDYSYKNNYLQVKDFQNVPESNKLVSVLKFSSPQEKKGIQRLHKLFGVTVEYPSLLPLTKFLIKLPLDMIFTFIFFAWYGYCYRIRMEKTKKSLPELLRLAVSMLRYSLSIKPISAD